MKHMLQRTLRYSAFLTAIGLMVTVVAAWSRSPSGADGAGAVARTSPTGDVMRGRYSVITHACGDCHGGFSNPGARGWLAGVMVPEQEFKIGPFTTRPRNLTPDNATGLGRFTERQIFNALKYGVRPEDTPDVDITSTTPGQGNFPE